MTEQKAVFPDRPDFGGEALGWEVFDWIAAHLKPGKRILELGSGEGTKILTKHWEVWSIEHEPRWVGYCPRSHYIHAPIVSGWYERRVLEDEMPKDYDMLLIDGPPKNLRQGILKNLDLFNFSVPVVIDDVQRLGDMQIALEIAKIKGLPVVAMKTDHARLFVGLDKS